MGRTSSPEAEDEHSTRDADFTSPKTGEQVSELYTFVDRVESFAERLACHQPDGPCPYSSLFKPTALQSRNEAAHISIGDYQSLRSISSSNSASEWILINASGSNMGSMYLAPRPTAIEEAIKFGSGKIPTSDEVLEAMAKHLQIEVSHIQRSHPPYHSKLVQMLRKKDYPQRNPYWNFTVLELRARMKKRGIKFPEHRIKENYVNLLTEADSKKLRLQDLPVEIRLKIYKLVLEETQTLTPTSHAEELVSQPALTKVSRGVRLETLPVFYGVNTFSVLLNAAHFGEQPRVCKDSVKWLNAIGKENIASLRHVSFETVYRWRMLVLHVELGGRKSDKHLQVMRTCTYHDLKCAKGHCRRWTESKKLEDVCEEVPGRVQDWLAVVETAVIEGSLSGFKMMELGVRVGQMLYDLRHVIN